MAVLGGTAKFAAYDSNGAPLNGGKLDTFEPGTSTPKSTFTTAAEGAANTNPVILDSRGEADVWFVGKYKLVLKDSDDVTIWTVDNYDPATLDLTNGVLDANGNELITFVSTTDAVNHIQVTNQSTGNDPTIAAVGDDTNINLVLAAKGSGVISFSSGFTFSDEVTIDGVAANAAKLTMGEDTSNGTDTITINAPASLAAARNLTLPAAAPSAGLYVQTDGSGIWSYVDVTTTDLTTGVSAASDTLAGRIEVAVQSEMETGTSTTLAVTPGRQGFHPGHPKGWIKFNGTGTIATNASHNVTSITDNGTGDYTVTWATDFSSADYAIATAAISENSSSGVAANITSMAAGTVRLNTISDDSNSFDTSIVTVIACGDQA